MRWLAVILLLLSGCETPAPVGPKPNVRPVKTSNAATRASIKETRREIKATSDKIKEEDTTLDKMDSVIDRLLNGE